MSNRQHQYVPGYLARFIEEIRVELESIEHRTLESTQGPGWGKTLELYLIAHGAPAPPLTEPLDLARLERLKAILARRRTEGTVPGMKRRDDDHDGSGAGGATPPPPPSFRPRGFAG